MCKCSGKCGCNITSTTKGEKGDSSSVASLGYKVYTALLTQSGTSAPTVKVLNNTLGVVPTLSYVGIGNYSINATGVFTQDKTWFSSISTIGCYVIEMVRDNSNSVLFYIFDSTNGAPQNDSLTDTPIEIRVYA